MSNTHLHPIFQTILAPYAPEAVSRFHIFGGFAMEDDFLGSARTREDLTRFLAEHPEADCVMQRDCDGRWTEITGDVLP